MPNLNCIPSYRRHKKSGQAIVTLPDGLGGRKDFLLGKYGTRASREEYARILAEWEAADRRLPESPAAKDISVSELIAAYYRFCKTYYRKDGKLTSEPDTVAQAMRFVKELYSRTLAKDFGPLALKAVQQAMIRHDITRKIKVTDPETGEVREEVKIIRHGLGRRYINQQIGRIKRMFGWAVEQELLPACVHEALIRVKGLRKGKSEARETGRVRPVPEAFVQAVLPLVPAVIRTMIEVQRLCGGRPQDVVGMRATDIDMTSPVWEYRPVRYKTEHHAEDDPDRERIVFLGPRAQELLKPYLQLDIQSHLFRPDRSELERNSDRREKRKTPLWPSHLKHQGMKKSLRRKRPPRDHYDVAAYRRAIHRTCDKAGIPRWSPHRLRHSRGTEIRKLYGLEAAQAVLGHAELGVTQVYAEADREAARRIMAAIG
jgi:integrase